MTKKIGHKAAIPNPALNPLKTLIGEWKTVGTHPLAPDTILHGHSSFKWMEELSWFGTQKLTKKDFQAELPLLEVMRLRENILCFILTSEKYQGNTKYLLRTR